MTDFFFYPKKSHTGGTAESTDGIDGSILKDGDAVFVVDPATRKLDVLTLDADSAAAEDSPRVIKPDANAGDKRFVKVKTHDGLHEYLSFYTNFEAAIAGIGSTVKTLVVDTTSTIVLDCTVPATLTIEVRRGSILTVSSAKTLTINGKFLCKKHQAFAGAGTVVFGATAVHEIYPEWWGTFPNGTNDTAILNKAIAASSLSGWQDMAIVVGPGEYYITPAGLSTITVSFIAPYSQFIGSEQVVQARNIFKFDFTTAIYPRIVKIGSVFGNDPLVDTDHYSNGIFIDGGDNADFYIGYLYGLYKGLVLYGVNAHVGLGKFKINSIVGCDVGIYLESGTATNEECEASVFDINYITWCKKAIQIHSPTGNKPCTSNIFNIDVMELNAYAGAQGIVVAGLQAYGNTFKVNNLSPPSGAGGYIVATSDDCHDNIYELAYMDWTLMSLAGGYEIFRQDGKSNSTYPATWTNDYARSTIMLDAAPTGFPWRDGDKVWNNSPGDGTLGWVNYAAGTPGSWIKFGGVYFEGSEVWDPGSIAAGSYEQEDITVTGAALGDFAIASFSISTALLRLDAQVVSTNVVSVQLFNPTTGAIDLASGTMYVRVYKR